MKIETTDKETLSTINLAVLGGSKSGKTTLTSTIKEKTLLINADKGTLSLKKHKIHVTRVTNWLEMVDVMKFITNEASMKKHGYKWVVFDSMTAIANILKKHLEEQGVTGFDFWNDYKKLIGGIMTTTRDTTLFNSLTIYQQIEKANKYDLLEKKFGLEGSLASEVPFFYDFVFASKKIAANKDKPERFVIQTTNLKDYDFLGGRGNKLNDFEPSNIDHIVKKLLA